MIIRELRKSDNPFPASMIRKVFEEFYAPRMGTVYSDPSTDDFYNLFREPGSVLWVAQSLDKPMGSSGHTGCNIWMLLEYL